MVSIDDGWAGNPPSPISLAPRNPKGWLVGYRGKLEQIAGGGRVGGCKSLGDRVPNCLSLLRNEELARIWTFAAKVGKSQANYGHLVRLL
jgi:hypothetical protein